MRSHNEKEVGGLNPVRCVVMSEGIDDDVDSGNLNC